MIRLLTALLPSAVVAITLASPPPLPSPPMPHGDALTVGVWTIHTASLDFNDQTGDFSLPQHVTMTREGGDISADRASGNFKTQIMTLYGNVTMHDLSGSFAGLASGSVTRPSGPSTLTADQVRIDGKAKVYVATGHVHYVQQNTTVDSNQGTLNDALHMLYLDGNVKVVQGSRSVDADHVVYNTITGDAHAEGNVTMQFPTSVTPHIATPKPIKIWPHRSSTPTPTP